jgi:hypothetical protein
MEVSFYRCGAKLKLKYDLTPDVTREMGYTSIGRRGNHGSVTSHL